MEAAVDLVLPATSLWMEAAVAQPATLMPKSSYSPPRRGCEATLVLPAALTWRSLEAALVLPAPLPYMRGGSRLLAASP